MLTSQMKPSAASWKQIFPIRRYGAASVPWQVGGQPGAAGHVPPAPGQGWALLAVSPPPQGRVGHADGHWRLRGNDTELGSRGSHWCHNLGLFNLIMLPSLGLEKIKLMVFIVAIPSSDAGHLKGALHG